jgi:hypothetical protein
VRLDGKIVEVRPPENDSGIGGGGRQPQVAWDGSVETDAIHFYRALNRGLEGHEVYFREHISYQFTACK